MDVYRKYFDPQTLSKLDGLELKARMIVEGLVSGLHRSPYEGFSVEFAEHRDYVPGDDLRYVDWKVFGKTDRIYLKQYEEETNFACYVVVDASESMRYKSAGAAVSKFEYAQYLAAALAFLVLRQHDAAGLVLFDDEIREFIRASAQASQLKALLRALDQRLPAGPTGVGVILDELAERIRKRGLSIIISDLFDSVDSIVKGLKHFRHRRHDVAVLQVIDPAEEDFPFEEPTLFRGLEGGPELLSEPRALKKAYQREFRGFLDSLRRHCRDLHVEHILLRTDTPLDVGLRTFVSARSDRLHRS